MAALPSYVDTGITDTHTLSLEVIVRAQVPSGDILPDFNHQSNTVRLFTRAVTALHGRTDLVDGGGAGIDTADTIELVLQYGPEGTQVIVATETGIANTGEPPTFPAVTVTRTDGPVRLGVAVDGSDRLVYEWFEDTATTLATVVGGTTVQSLDRDDPPVSLGGSGRVLWYGLGTETEIIAEYYRVRFQNPTFNGSSAGAGPYDFFVGGPSSTRYFGPPWKYTVDARVIGPDGIEIAGVDLEHEEIARTSGTWTITELIDTAAAPPPFNFTPLNLTQPVGAPTLADPWLSDQTVRPDDTEHALIFEGQAPKNPAAAFTTWTVGTMETASPLNVLLSPTAWTTTGSVTVSANTPPLDIVVSGAGATVTRSLLSHWRNWNDSGDPLFEATDDYTATARAAYSVGGATPDVWGWGRYAYLRASFSAAPAATLVLTITWDVILEDNTIVTVDRSYSKAVNGAGDYEFDLLFPDEGDVPFYGERVKEFTISGFAVGTYTLTDLELYTDEDAYVRWGSRLSTDTGGVTIAQDGQMCIAHWGRDTSSDGEDENGDFLIDHDKDDMNGVFEYGLSETDPISIEWLGGAVGRGTAATLQAILNELSLMEGVTASYNGATLEAALTDGTNTIGTAGTRAAGWLLPNLPGDRHAANVAYNLPARFMCSDILAPAGRTTANTIWYARSRLGCVIEGQGVTLARGRAAAAQTVNARAFVEGAATADDPSLGSAATDASGFVTIPIRTGQFKVAAGDTRDFWVYIF